MPEFAVLGGGVIGLSTALRLATRGREVTVLERAMGLRSATLHSAGIMTLQLESPGDALMVKRSIEILEEFLGDAEPSEAGIVGRGFVSIEDAEDAEETAEILREAGVEFEQFDGTKASKLWPHLSFREGEVATYTRLDASVEPKTFLKFLQSKALEAGAELHSKCLVESLRASGSRVEAVSTSEGEVRAEVFFLCLGPWNKRFLAEMGVLLPTWVIRCPAYRFKLSNHEGVPAFADEIYHSYWRPGVNGTLVGGGYHAESAEDPEECFGRPPKWFTSDTERLLRLRLRCGFKLEEEWTGPCSITPDYEPIIGLVEGFENLYVVDGLRGYGLMRGLAIGFSIADIALGKTPEVDLTPYSPSRFRDFFD